MRCLTGRRPRMTRHSGHLIVATAMIRPTLLWILACLAAWLVVPFPVADAAEKRVALVVGVSAYRHVPRLPNTTNDARAVAAALTRMGFEVATLLDPDRAGFEAAVRNFGERARGADASLFFYAGHALELGGRNWLIPATATLRTDRDLRFETPGSRCRAGTDRRGLPGVAGVSRRLPRQPVSHAPRRGHPRGAPWRARPGAGGDRHVGRVFHGTGHCGGGRQGGPQSLHRGVAQVDRNARSGSPTDAVRGPARGSRGHPRPSGALGELGSGRAVPVSRGRGGRPRDRATGPILPRPRPTSKRCSGTPSAPAVIRRNTAPTWLGTRMAISPNWRAAGLPRSNRRPDRPATDPAAFHRELLARLAASLPQLSAESREERVRQYERRSRVTRRRLSRSNPAAPGGRIAGAAWRWPKKPRWRAVRCSSVHPAS